MKRAPVPGRVLTFPASGRSVRRRQAPVLLAPQDRIKAEWNVTEGYSAFVGYDRHDRERVRIILPNDDFTDVAGAALAGKIHAYLVEHCDTIARPVLRVVR